MKDDRGLAETGIGDLYRGVILEHFYRPRNRRRLEGASVTAEGRNPLCGDDIVIDLAVRGGRIEAVGFEGHGCAISMAAASILSEMLEGLDAPAAGALIHAFSRFLKGEDRSGIGEDELGDLAAFAGVAKFPVRIKCALLPFKAVDEVLPRFPKNR